MIIIGRTGHCRQHILDCGLEVLATKGYNGTGVKEIVDAAEVPKGSFYNHFASKEAFVVEAIEKLAQQNLEKTELALTNPDIGPKQRILNYFESNFEMLKQNDFKSGCLFGNLCLEMSDENESIRQATDKTMCQYTKLIANCLKEAKPTGSTATPDELCELAQFIHFSWEGAIMRMKGSKTPAAYSIFQQQLVKLIE